MRVTVKGQVTIPEHIREKLGIRPQSEVDFIEECGRGYLVKKEKQLRDRVAFGASEESQRLKCQPTKL